MSEIHSTQHLVTVCHFLGKAPNGRQVTRETDVKTALDISSEARHYFGREQFQLVQYVAFLQVALADLQVDFVET